MDRAYLRTYFKGLRQRIADVEAALAENCYWEEERESRAIRAQEQARREALDQALRAFQEAKAEKEEK